MRCDSAFASIYDENNVEIENAEMLFMDEGVYFYRAYSNGHPYDTSQVPHDTRIFSYAYRCIILRRKDSPFQAILTKIENVHCQNVLGSCYKTLKELLPQMPLLLIQSLSKFFVITLRKTDRLIKDKLQRVSESFKAANRFMYQKSSMNWG